MRGIYKIGQACKKKCGLTMLGGGESKKNLVQGEAGNIFRCILARLRPSVGGRGGGGKICIPFPSRQQFFAFLQPEKVALTQTDNRTKYLLE
jgi:hypothetical protein